MVCESCNQNISQDALRPELWRVNLERNCRLMNGHVPLQTVGLQSNTDEAGVLTRAQAELYLCKYCTKHCKRVGQRSVLYEVMDEMQRLDKAAKEQDEYTFKPRTLHNKLHRAFMAEVGEEMCQAEVAHHAWRCANFWRAAFPQSVHTTHLQFI